MDSINVALRVILEMYKIQNKIYLKNSLHFNFLKWVSKMFSTQPKHFGGFFPPLQKILNGYMHKRKTSVRMKQPCLKTPHLHVYLQDISGQMASVSQEWLSILRMLVTTICKRPEADDLLQQFYVPGTKRCELLHVSACVPCVVHPHWTVAQPSINVVVVVMAPTAAPHRFPSVVGLYHSVGKQAVEKYTTG